MNKGLLNIYSTVFSSLFKGCLALVLFFVSSNITLAQDCDKTLEEARRFYNIGQIEKVGPTLEPCMEKGFSRSQKSEAFQLLVMTYQYDNQPKKAEDEFVKLLKHDPEFSLESSSSSAVMRQLLNTYHAPPIYSIGFMGGVNTAMAQRIQSFSLANAEQNLSTYAADGLGFQVGLIIKRYISKSFELNLDILYSQVKYSKTFNQLDFSTVVFEEAQEQLNIPLSVTYTYDLGKFSPYARIGGGISYLLDAEALVERTYADQSFNQLPNVTGPSLDVMNMRNNLNFYSTAGFGIQYKIPRGRIYLDFRHNWNFLLQNRPSKRFENNILVYEYHYIDDDFKLGNMAISLGYTFSFHKIKLLDKKRVTLRDE